MLSAGAGGWAGPERGSQPVARGLPRWPLASRPSRGAPGLARCDGGDTGAWAEHGAGRGSRGRGSPGPCCPRSGPCPSPGGFRQGGKSEPAGPAAGRAPNDGFAVETRTVAASPASSQRPGDTGAATHPASGPRGWRGATGLSPWPVPGRAPRWGSGFLLPSPAPRGREGTGWVWHRPPQPPPPAWHRCHRVPPGAPSPPPRPTPLVYRPRQRRPGTVALQFGVTAAAVTRGPATRRVSRARWAGTPRPAPRGPYPAGAGGYRG